MRWICAICTEVFDLSKPICFAPCGHIFHRGCLETWLQESSTCPECRASVDSSCLKKIYPNAKINNEVEYSVDNLDALLEKLRRQEEKITSYEQHLLLVTSIATESIAEAAELRRKNFDNQLRLIFEHLQEMIMRPQERELENLKIEIRNLKVENELCNDVKAIIQGEQKEVDKIIRECQEKMGDRTGSLEIVTKLATFLAVLKREINMLVAKKNEITAECVVLREEFASKNQVCEKLLDKLSKFCSEDDDQNLNGISKKSSTASNLSSATNNFDDSPITIKFNEKKRKIGTIVIDDVVNSAPSTSASCNKSPVIRNLRSKGRHHGFSIAVGSNIEKNSNFVHPDPKLVRRVKLSKKISKK